MKWFAAALAGLCLLGLVGLLSYRSGYSAAQAASGAAALASQRDAYARVAKDEAAQMTAQRAVEDGLAAELARADASAAALRTRLAAVPVARDCTVGPDAVAILNQARAGQ